MNINDNAKSSASQCAQIKAWLLQGNKLTSLEALNKFGCMRLASRIHDLRNASLDIHKERIITPSGKYVTQYSICNTIFHCDMNEAEVKLQNNRIQKFHAMAMELMYNKGMEEKLAKITNLDVLNFISRHKKRLSMNLSPSDLYAIKNILTNSVALYNDSLQQSLENL